MSEEPRKRSRFDQTESEAPRKSRFDRRSRSPTDKAADASRRSRSPVLSPTSAESKKDASAAAAAAAAKINASLGAKKGLQQVDVPPIRSNPSPGAAAGAIKSPTDNKASGTLNDDIYQQDGDYIRDIEVNDLRNRYTLTKGSTQKMIKEKTGADVTTRGNYYPDKSMATPAQPPLYLHITSQTKDGLEKAVAEIEELMKHDLPNLIDERRFRRREPEQPQVERDSLGRRKWPEERIPIDLEPIPGFNLRAQVVGQGGAYVKHIQQETRCRVQIKGRGSGFIEHDTGRESDEQMYLHVAGPDAGDVQTAKEQCIDLLGYVKQNYDSFKASRTERRQQGGGGYGGGDQGGYGGPRDRNGSNSYGGGSQYGGGSAYGGNSQYGGGYGQGTPNPADGYGGYGGGAQSPTAAQTPGQQQGQQGQQPQMTPEQMHAWSQYYSQYPDQDPYAAYGGFAVVMQAYMGGQQQQQPQQQAPPPPPPPGGYGATETPPPPPPPPGL